MTHKESFNKNIQLIKDKFNNNIILIDNIEFFKRKDKVKWKCNIHQHEFISSIDNLLNETITQGCDKCKIQKLKESGLKSVSVKKQNKLKDIK